MAGAGLPRPSSDENISTTLAAGITDVATSFDVADGSKIVSPCYLVIDRVDSAGTVKTASLWEYVKVTNVSTNTLTVTRGQGGSTAQAHSSGAVVEAVVTSSMFEDWYDALDPEHTSTGGHAMGTASVSLLQASGILSSVASVGVAQTFNLAASSIASIARIQGTNALFGTATITNVLNDSAIVTTAWTDWTPTLGGSASMTFTSTTVDIARYCQIGNVVYFQITAHGTTGGTASTYLTFTLPPVTPANDSNNLICGGCAVLDGSGLAGYWDYISSVVRVSKYDNSNWGLGSGRYIQVQGFYEVA